MNIADVADVAIYRFKSIFFYSRNTF